MPGVMDSEVNRKDAGADQTAREWASFKANGHPSDRG
jgi:hypothetical protein